MASRGRCPIAKSLTAPGGPASARSMASVPRAAPAPHRNQRWLPRSARWPRAIRPAASGAQGRLARGRDQFIERAQGLGLSVQGSERVDAEHARLDRQPALRIAGLIGVKGGQAEAASCLARQRAYRSGQEPLLAQTLHRRSRLLGRVGRCGCSGQCRGHRAGAAASARGAGKAGGVVDAVAGRDTRPARTAGWSPQTDL